MRVVLCGFLLLFSVVLSYVRAQSFVPIPADPSSKWKVGFFNYDPPNTYDETRVYYLDGQFINNGNTYNRLLANGIRIFNGNPVPFSNMYVGGIRTEEYKVYFLSDQGLSLLYDFTLEPGDTLPESSLTSGVVVVTSVDSIMINGTYRKRINIESPQYGELHSHWYIEGIGHEKGIIEPMWELPGMGWYFYCYQENGSTVFPEGEECDLSVGINNLASEAEKIQVTINPDNGLVRTVISDMAGETLRCFITSVSGQIICSKIINISSTYEEHIILKSSSSKGLNLIAFYNSKGKQVAYRKMGW